MSTTEPLLPSRDRGREPLLTDRRGRAIVGRGRETTAIRVKRYRDVHGTLGAGRELNRVREHGRGGTEVIAHRDACWRAAPANVLDDVAAVEGARSKRRRRRERNHGLVRIDADDASIPTNVPDWRDATGHAEELPARIDLERSQSEMKGPLPSF